MRTLTVFGVLTIMTLCVAAQDPQPKPAKPEPKVEVPTFANSTCPVMAKRSSLRLHVDTDYGRIYICCKPCDRKILADVETAYRAAYPTTKEIHNEVCPVTGEKIGEGAESITLQGHSFKVADKKAMETARKNAQITLVKVTDPTVFDLDNPTCPIQGEPVVRNAFVLIDKHLVRLSSSTLLEQVKKDAAGVLKKAIELARNKPVERSGQVIN